MNLNSKSFAGTPVQTRSGMTLGRLASLDFDADTGHLVSIRVHAGLVKGLLADELIIAWSQIVEMKPKKIIVSDTSIPAGASVIALA